MNDGDSGIIKGLFIGLAAGFVAGAVTALFLTTRTGEELRSDIKRIAFEIKGKVEEKAGAIKNISREKYNEIVNNVVSGYKKMKDFTEKEIEMIKKMVME